MWQTGWKDSRLDYQGLAVMRGLRVSGLVGRRARATPGGVATCIVGRRRTHRRVRPASFTEARRVRALLHLEAAMHDAPARSTCSMSQAAQDTAVALTKASPALGVAVTGATGAID